MSKRWIAAAVVIAVAAGIGWYIASPWYTLREMRSATQANDAEALSAHIDYPALREDLKAEIMAQMMAEARKDTSGFGALGTAFATAMIGPMVDGMVSPAGMRAAFAANRKRQAADQKKPGAGAFDVSEDVEVERRGLDEFAVVNPKRSDGKMVFRRHGLGWKLSGVDLPAAD